uniref:NADH-ubiquinone oxidoreductase chain 4 n=1 Tax=Beraea pullata TaxID=177796 RepID=A0A7G7CEL4_9NEOP|nr:NADH dehydrogenase subunit 4 [Beraea pullata]
MMKIIFFMISIFFFMMKKKYWMVQMMIYLLMVLMIFYSLNFFFMVNMSYMFGMDMISYFLLLLSIWVCGLMMMASFLVYMNNYNIVFFMINLLLLLILLVCTFSVMNLFMFYLFFEGSLIPILLLILGWGYQPERIQAGIYLLFYTLFMSLPMLIGIFYLFNQFNSMMFYFLGMFDINNFILFIILIMSFLVKMPMVFIHLWLPKAHVEAPISGSMILAAIMLKLGAYGIIRLMIMFQYVILKFNYFFISLSLLGGIYISLMCLHQVDMKSLIAYSSVVHMSGVLSGLLILNFWGYNGAYMMLIGHGLCSSGLFCILNLSYERSFSRMLMINKGLLLIMPNLCMWWFLLLSSNMSAPPSLNLISEISLINSLISWSQSLMLLLIMLCFFSALYSLYLYMSTQHGKFLLLNNLYFINSREYLLMFLHWVPLNFLIFQVDLVSI